MNADESSKKLNPMSNDALLAFVTDAHGQLFAHMDKAGLDLLIDRLQRIRDGVERGECPHDHFFSEEWSSAQQALLTSSTMMNKSGEGQSVHHLKVFGWTQEWAQRHGLYGSSDRG